MEIVENGKVEIRKMENNVSKRCMLCPRNCLSDREQGELGYCGQTTKLRVARAALHQWEEPCLSGTVGSGTVFFTGCSLGCVYCQNQEIAAGKVGKEISIKRLAEIFLELQKQGAHNINLVTATHFVPQVAEALREAKQKGLTLPIVYNTSSYEHVSTIRQLEGLVDIYLPDLKYKDSALSFRYSHAADYFSYASRAIAEMVRQAGNPVFSEEGLMKRGVIVRHLVLPEGEADSKEILRYLYETYGEQIYISIMNQFTPMPGLAAQYPELNRTIRKREYSRIVEYAIRLGIEQGFIQEGKTAMESFIPSFDCEGV